VLGCLPINVKRLHEGWLVVFTDELLVHVKFVGECDTSLLDVDQLAHFETLVKVVLHSLLLYFLLPFLDLKLLLGDLTLHDEGTFIDFDVVHLAGSTLLNFLLPGFEVLEFDLPCDELSSVDSLVTIIKHLENCSLRRVASKLGVGFGSKLLEGVHVRTDFASHASLTDVVKLEVLVSLRELHHSVLELFHFCLLLFVVFTLDKWIEHSVLRAVVFDYI